MKPREFVLSTGTKIFLGRDSKNNDELVSSYKGKENIIIHTVASGSPFCVIEKLNPTKDEIYEAGIFTASKSQDWRDRKSEVKIHVFTSYEIKKSFLMKEGSWKLKSKPQEITIKKKDILKLEKP
ncbi:hypothetical protein COU58_03915 [Candidatus Pacearchaeota archaeon CG10_big_fil_rev_8_21_14_0_10_32_42]|nr:MAG: hypothetical protein COU58_03915 [Candidatus Pacearchaeota archaeon CG10_big_fil_rev_8_21_14_0_10_32_42]